METTLHGTREAISTARLCHRADTRCEHTLRAYAETTSVIIDFAEVQERLREGVFLLDARADAYLTFGTENRSALH